MRSRPTRGGRTGPPGRGGRAAPPTGFTLLELLFGVAILGTLAAIAIPAYNDALDKAKTVRAIADISTIQNELLVYQVFNGQLPVALSQLDIAVPLDPWNNPYQYLNFATVHGTGQMRKDRFLVPINSTFDLYSMGKDGQSVPPLTAQASQDDIIRANDGGFIGLAANY